MTSSSTQDMLPYIFLYSDTLRCFFFLQLIPEGITKRIITICQLSLFRLLSPMPTFTPSLLYAVKLNSVHWIKSGRQNTKLLSGRWTRITLNNRESASGRTLYDPPNTSLHDLKNDEEFNLNWIILLWKWDSLNK